MVTTYYLICGSETWVPLSGASLWVQGSPTGMLEGVTQGCSVISGLDEMKHLLSDRRCLQRFSSSWIIKLRYKSSPWCESLNRVLYNMVASPSVSNQREKAYQRQRWMSLFLWSQLQCVVPLLLRYSLLLMQVHWNPAVLNRRLNKNMNAIR